MKGVTRTFLVEEFKLHWTVLHCPWNTYTINLISVIINIENKEIFTEDWIGMSFLFIETKGFQLLHTFATLGSVWKEFYLKKKPAFKHEMNNMNRKKNILQKIVQTGGQQDLC